MFSPEELKEKDYLEENGVEERIILKWVLKYRVGGCRLDTI
jgi:hypothetical protein